MRVFVLAQKADANAIRPGAEAMVEYTGQTAEAARMLRGAGPVAPVTR